MSWNRQWHSLAGLAEGRSQYGDRPWPNFIMVVWYRAQADRHNLAIALGSRWDRKPGFPVGAIALGQMQPQFVSFNLGQTAIGVDASN